MPKKFVMTDIYHSETTPFGSGLPFEFVELPIMLAAQKAGFENFRLLSKTLRKETDGTIKANITSVKIFNEDLLDRIVEDENVLKEIIAVSSAWLGAMHQVGEVEAKYKEHNQKTFPFNVSYLNRVFKEFRNHPQSQELIARITALAAREPAIKFNPDLGFIERKIIPDVDLVKFLQVQSKRNENVFYIRSLVRSEDERVLPLLEELREKTAAKFPVSPESQKFHDKEIVIDDARLKKYAMPSQCFSTEDGRIIENLVQFYKEHGRAEGVVLKPGKGGSFGGTAVMVLDPDIADDEIEKVVREKITTMNEEAERLYQTRFCVGSIIAQKRLFNLSAADDLRAGDIRFSVINGELVGAALRYSDDSSVTVLSYARTKSVLPDNLSFTKENIEKLRDRADSADKISYYDTLLKMHEAVQDVVSWSKENHHFHDGVDILLGRDRSGKWQFCLTEVNNVIPDCIPETRWLNERAHEPQDRVRICDWMVRVIESNQHLTARTSASPTPTAQSAKRLHSEAVATQH